MRIITKLVLALMAVGSLAFTSCKDYDEDNYNNAVINNPGTVDEALKQQITAMENAIQELQQKKCQCNYNITDSVMKVISQNGDAKTVINNYITSVLNEKNIENQIRDLQDRIAECEKAGVDSAKVVNIIENNTLITQLKNDVEALKNAGSDELSNRIDKIYSDSIMPAYNTAMANKDSIAKIQELIKNIDLSKYYTKDEVDAKFASLDTLAKSLDSCKANCEKMMDKRLELVNARIDAANARIDTTYTAITGLYIITDMLAEADSVLQDQIDTLSAKVADLTDRVSALEDARIKQVTGIIVQQVYNPAFGSYNSVLSNVQTNALIAYVGYANNDITFPSNDDEAAKIEFRSGQLLMDQTAGNAGKLYVTINPSHVDFDGVQGLTLVNSQDEPCAIKLGAVRKSDKVLTNGYTRAASNGFYEVDATLSPVDLMNKDLYLDIDKSAIKSSLKQLFSSSTAGEAKTALKDFAITAGQAAANINPVAQGVKCSWSDAYGTHSVNSEYNITALATNPLGFNAVDAFFDKEGNGAYWRLYDKAKGIISKTAATVGKNISNTINNQMNLGNLKADIADLQAKIKDAHMKKIDPTTGKIVVETNVTVPQQEVEVKFDVPVDISQVVNVSGDSIDVVLDTTFVVNVPKSFNVDGTVKEYEKQLIDFDIERKFPVSASALVDFHDTIHIDKKLYVGPFTTKVTIDITEQVNQIFNSLLGDINNSFDSVNALVDALSAAMEDVNVMLDGINKLQETLESGSYISGVFNYLDKFANNIARYTPQVFKPVLLVNSTSGFGFAGMEGAPTTVSGSVTVYATTYSAEILAPIFKRYIRVNDNPGQILQYRTLDITSQLKKGLNKVEYRALDYQGNEYAGYYYLNVE